MNVRIKSYIDQSDITLVAATAASIIKANEVDIEENLLTKLYYILPRLGKIIVVVSDADRDIIGTTNNVLDTITIADYPLAKLPAQIIDYNELIIRIGNTLTDPQVLDAAQNLADDDEMLAKHKIPLVKVINYNNSTVSKLVTHSIFGAQFFSTVDIPAIDVAIANDGNASVGKLILTSMGEIVSEDIIQEPNAEADALFGNGTFNNCKFGSGVAINSTKMAISSLETIQQPLNPRRVGAVYVSNLDGTNQIKIQQTNLVGNHYNYFGDNLAMNDTKIIVGHKQQKQFNIYDLDGTNEIVVSSPEYLDQGFSERLEVNSQYILTRIYEGHDLDVFGFSGSGAFYRFDIDGTNPVRVMASDKVAGAKEHFGKDLAINETKIVAASAANKFYILNTDLTGETIIKAVDVSAISGFGSDVAISQTKIITRDNQKNLYVFDLTGTLLYKFNVGFSIGPIYITDDKIFIRNASKIAMVMFNLDGTNPIEIAASDAANNTGWSGYGAEDTFATNGNQILIGNPYRHGAGYRLGAVYKYN